MDFFSYLFEFIFEGGDACVVSVHGVFDGFCYASDYNLFNLFFFFVDRVLDLFDLCIKGGDFGVYAGVHHSIELCSVRSGSVVILIFVGRGGKSSSWLL